MVSSRKILILFLGLSYAVICYIAGLLVMVVDNANLYYGFFSVITIIFCFLMSGYVGVSKVSILNLFLVAYSVFVFGRCFYIVIGVFFVEIDQAVENLYALFWMADHVVDGEGARFLFLLTNLFILFVTVGYIVGYAPGALVQKKLEADKAYRGIMFFLLFASAPVYFYDLISIVLATMSQGYLAKFSGQGDGGGGSSIVKHIFYVSLISLIVFDKKRIKYYLIFLLIPLLSILSGGRGGFVYPVLTFVYLYFRLNPGFKLGFIKLSIILIFVFLSMSFLLQFSARGQASTDDFFDSLYFLYAQGVTLGVISFSILSGLPYEWHTLAQSFVPAMARMYSFFNPGTPGYMGSITTFISYYANPEMFVKGNGLGSSIVSELYILSFRFFPLFLLNATLLGLLFSYIEVRSYRSWRFFVFLMVVLPFVINSPRNGFNVLLVSSIYVFGLISLFFIFSKLRFRIQRGGLLKSH